MPGNGGAESVLQSRSERRLASVHRHTYRVRLRPAFPPVRLAGGRPGGRHGGEPVTGRHRRRRRRRCTWRAGPATPGPGRIAWWFSGQRGRRLPARRAAAPRVQRRGDERVPQRVRPDGLGDPGAAGDLADDPRGAMPVQPPAIGSQEDRPFAAFADGQVDRPRGAWRERDSDDLAALAGDHQGPVPALDAQASMSAPVASETRSPLRASREISACSAGGPSPAATSSAPSSLRSRPVAWDS